MMFYKWLENENCFAFLEYAREGFTEIEDTEYANLLQAQERGMVIAKADDGSPMLADRPPLTLEQIVSMNTANRDVLMSEATSRIAPLQDAVDLDEASADEIAALKKWKSYRVALNRLDMSVDPVVWPSPGV